MASIQVGTGALRLGFAEALGRATPGDTLVLHEGVHAVGSCWLTDLRIVGSGNPENIVLETNIEVRGTLELSGFTLRAPHYGNALQCKADASSVVLRQMRVLGDPAEKYPVVYASAGALECLATRIEPGPSDACAVQALQGVSVRASDSDVGALVAVGANVQLMNVRSRFVHVEDRGRLESRGWLDLSPAAGQRGLRVIGESVAHVSWLRELTPDAEALCSDAFLGIDTVDLAPDERYCVVVEDGGKVRVPPECLVGDPQEIAGAAAAGRRVEWSPADGPLADAVAPLREGDTLVLAPGVYDVCADAGMGLSIGPGVDILGSGAPEETVLRGQLMADGGNLSLSNLEVQSPPGLAAVMVHDGGRLVARDVLLRSRPAGSSDLPTVLSVEDATAELTGVEVVSDAASTTGGTFVCGNGILHGEDCALGWLAVTDASELELSGRSSARQVLAQDDAVVRSLGELELLPTEGEFYGLFVTDSASAELRDLGSAGRTVRVFGAGTGHLRIVGSPGGATVVLHATEDFDVDLEEAAVEAHRGELLDNGEFDVLDAAAPPSPGASSTVHTSTDPDEPGAVTIEDPDWRPRGHAASEAALSCLPERGEQVGTPQGGIEEHATGEGATSGPALPWPSDEPDPLEELRRLPGLARVKQQVEDFVTQVRFNRMREEQGLKPLQTTLHSVFLGNPGTGKTTVARLLGLVLHRAGAIREDKFREVGRKDLVGMHLGESAKLTASILEDASGGVLFVDEAYSLYQPNNNEFAQEAVDELLAHMENHRDDLVVVLAGYADKMQDFLAMNPGLRSRIPHRFDFEDYSAEEIAEIGLSMLRDSDVDVSDEQVYRRAVASEYRRSGDRSNGRWVRNFNDTLVTAMAKRVQAEGGRDVVTCTIADLRAVTDEDPRMPRKNLQELLEQVDALTGLAPVKTWVHDLVSEVRANQRMTDAGIDTDPPTYHMVFTGNPGTGKTTVAHLVARLFHTLGILRTPTVKVVDRSDLVGVYYGVTERQTTRAIDEAMGGVLFVDEAYQLAPAGDNDRDFGHRAIDTFITRLENDRERFVSIFAGYTEPMNRFLDANPGMRSRLPRVIEFPDYTPDEVAEIVLATLRMTWRVDESDVRDAVVRAYGATPEKERSNGRWARTFCDELVRIHKRWILLPDVTEDQVRTIHPDSVAAAAAHFGA